MRAARTPAAPKSRQRTPQPHFTICKNTYGKSSFVRFIPRGFKFFLIKNQLFSSKEAKNFKINCEQKGSGRAVFVSFSGVIL
jgi:hypothetical protein